MSPFTLGFLFAVVIPLAEGVLLALLLREVYNRHPLPLGGAIVPVWWKQFDPAPTAPQPDQEEIADIDNASEPSAVPPPPDDVPNDSEGEQDLSPQTWNSFFDGTENIPADLPVSDILDAMIKETPAVNLNDFEAIIDQSSVSGTAMPDAYASTDDMDEDDLQALADALPGTKIDFSQETGPEETAEMQAINKALLGDLADVETLERQSRQLKESLEFPVYAPDKAALEIQEDESGIVQVSSSFVADVMPQLADFVSPMTVLPTFENDWIQESGSLTGGSGEDATKFCFTEESTPMLARKRKTPG